MEFTQEHEGIRRSLKSFIDTEINPHVDEWERDGIFPAHELFRKMGNLGFLGINKPVEYGGLGLDYSYQMVMIEALAVGTPVLAYPEGAAPEGSFSQPDDIVGRGLIVPLVKNEPVLPAKLAQGQVRNQPGHKVGQPVKEAHEQGEEPHGQEGQGQDRARRGPAEQSHVDSSCGRGTAPHRRIRAAGPHPSHTWRAGSTA